MRCGWNIFCCLVFSFLRKIVWEFDQGQENTSVWDDVKKIYRFGYTDDVIICTFTIVLCTVQITSSP